jgi:hypothetical protein
LGSLTWLTYAYGKLCQDGVAPGEFYSSNMYANTIFLDWALQLMYVCDQLLIIISSIGIVATLGMGAGPSKLW